MRRANPRRRARGGSTHSQEAQAGPEGRKRRTVKAAVDDQGVASAKQPVEALREPEARYRALVQHIRAIVYIAALDEASATLYISPQVESLLGISPAEWTAHPELFVERLHPEDRERVLADLALSHGSGEPFVSEYRMLAGDGSVRWFRDEAAVISNAAGESLFLQGVMLDITERKEAEEALRKSYEELETRVAQRTAELSQANASLRGEIAERKRAKEKTREQSEFLWSTLDSLSHPFYVIDAKDYTIKMANAAAGFRRLSTGATCYALTHGFSEPCGDNGHVCPLEEVKRTRAPLTVEHVHRDRHGRPRIYEVHCYPILDSAGNVKELIEYTLDITERKRAEEELRRLNELKSDFLALASHELRSPLTSLGGGLELIAQDAPSLPPRAQRALELMSQECARLTTLVESTLDMTRLDAGELPLTFGPAWLKPVIAEAAASIAGAGSHHPVDVRVPHGLPPAWADEVHLGQVLRNLLSNAVKYSAWGQPIVIEARAEGDSLMISITDRGQGVSREEQQHIFDAFYRAVGTDESSVGYGLGLYFARKLIEAQGGAIGVESPAFDDPAAPGTTFTVTLPIAEDEA